LIHYRSSTETLIECVGQRKVKTFAGEFDLHVFRDQMTGDSHLALTRGTIQAEVETLVRVHEPVSVIDWLDLGSSAHSWSIERALTKIAEVDNGVVILLNRTETGADLVARALPDLKLDAPKKWDLRTHGIGAQMLKALGVGKMQLMSPERKMPSMTGFGLEVVRFVQE